MRGGESEAAAGEKSANDPFFFLFFIFLLSPFYFFVISYISFKILLFVVIDILVVFMNLKGVYSSPLM